MMERCRGCGVDWETTEHPYEGFNCVDCRYLFGEPEDNAWTSRAKAMHIRRQNEVAAMRRRRLSNNQIARRVGVDERTIQRLVQRYEQRTGERLPRLTTRLTGAHPSTRARTPRGGFMPMGEDDPRVKRMKSLRNDKKMSYGRIAREMGVTVQTVTRYLRGEDSQ